MNKKVVNVAVGVVEHQGKILVAKRASAQHQGGLWEFPGGKIEQGETVFAALKRELLEEVDIEIANSSPLINIEHDYGDKCVALHVLHVTEFSGEAKGLEGQPVAWVDKTKLAELEFPEANKAIITAILEK